VRDEQRIDPFAVGGAADPGRVFGLHARREQRLHLCEAREVAVVRQAPGHALELERMHVLERDLHRRRVGDAAHVGEHAAGADFLGQVLQVAVENRQRLRAVGEGLLRRVRGRLPGAQAESGEVEQIQHPWHGALAHQRGIGLVRQVVEQYRPA
jgi:hypothetical protein